MLDALYEAIERSVMEHKSVYVLADAALQLNMFPNGSFQVENLLWKDKDGMTYKAILKMEIHGPGSMPGLYVVGNHSIDGSSSGRTHMFRKENRYVRPDDMVSMWIHFNEARVEKKGLTMEELMLPYLQICEKNGIFHPSLHLFEKSGEDSFALMGELMDEISRSGHLDLIDFWYWNVSGETENLLEGAKKRKDRS